MPYKGVACGAARHKLKVTPEEKLTMRGSEGEVRENLTNGMTSRQRLKAIGICQLDKARKYSSREHVICKSQMGAVADGDWKAANGFVWLKQMRS